MKMFWGCQIPAQLAFIELATRRVLDALGVPYSDLENTTCCPEKLAMAEKDKFHYQLTAARNLALAEKTGHDILVVCNGCYATLKTMSEDLRVDVALRSRVNERLGRVGLEVRGKARVRHLAELIVSDLGLPLLARKVKRPLAGMKIAVHYGCNLLRPHEALAHDDPLNPTSLDELVKALGGVSVYYGTKMDCCGGNYSMVNGQEQSERMLAHKLAGVRAAGAAALIVPCPACFTQFDVRQEKLLRGLEAEQIPVLHVSELLYFALGLEENETMVKRHRISVQNFLERWSQRAEAARQVATRFDAKLLSACAACGACREDCPVAAALESFNPNEIIEKVAEGRIAEVLEEAEFWNCLDCMTCYEMCPQRFGMNTVFNKLKEIATAEGRLPQTLAALQKSFYETGALAAASRGLRKRLGLPDPADPGIADLKKVLGEDRDEGEK